MIDSHCHLADDAFEADAEAVIGRAVAAGVEGALCILDAGSLGERSRALHLARAWPGLRVSIGVHPHQAAAWTGRTGDAVAEVGTAINGHPAARAVGEVGLDYHYDLAPRDVQRELFAAQLALARDRRLPVVIHAREADEDTVAIVREAGGGDVRGVMHCFTGSTDFARQALDLGLHVSMAGILTFPKADALREVARYLPADRLLVETDSPFLAPVPFRGKRNEPAWVVHVAERLAEVRGVSRAAIDELTSRNFMNLFECATGAGALDAARHAASP